jgi:hypothetical protein
MNDYCSVCLKEETLSDFAEGTTFTDVEDKTYCVKCFNDIEDCLIFCDRCFERSHKNENFSEQFVKTIDINNDVIYYHAKCLFEYELCPICKTYLKNKEYVDIFIDYGFQIKYHKSCIEDKDNIFKYDICDYCGISLRKKCENREYNCEYRFRDCYNTKCKNYSYIDEDGRYNGCCSRCNW